MSYTDNVFLDIGIPSLKYTKRKQILEDFWEEIEEFSSEKLTIRFLFFLPAQLSCVLSVLHDVGRHKYFTILITTP